MEEQLFSKRILAGLLIIFTLVTLGNAACTYEVIDGATITTQTGLSTVQCTAREDDPTDTILCHFSTTGDTGVSLANYNDPPITDYITLARTYDTGSDLTTITISTSSSLNDIADVDSSLTGSIICGAGPSDILVISLTEVDDNVPTFSQSEYIFNQSLLETFPPGIDLLQYFGTVITATDADRPYTSSSTMEFSIIAGDDDGTFEFKTDPACSGSCVGQLFVVGTIDYQVHPQYVLTLQATDEGSPPLSSTATLTITIQDYDDLDPAFNDMFYYSEVTKTDGSTFPLDITPAPIEAVDQDTGINASVSYQLLIDPNCGPSCDAISSAFTINPDTAVITFDSSVDLTVVNDRTITFGVKARQTDNAQRTAFALVSVTLPLPPTTTTQTTPTTTTETTTTPTTTMETTTTPPTTTTQTTTACPTFPPTTTTVTTPTSTITTMTTEGETTITTCTTVTYPTDGTDTTLPPTGTTATDVTATGTTCYCPDPSSTTVTLTTSDCLTGSTVVTTSEFSTVSPYTITTNTGSTLTITISDSTTADPTATPVTSYTCSPTDITGPTQDPTTFPTGMTCYPTVTDSLTSTPATGWPTGTTTPHTTTPEVTCPPCPTVRPEPVGNISQTTLISVLTPPNAIVMTIVDNSDGVYNYNLEGSSSFTIDPITGDISVNDYLKIGDYPLTVHATLDQDPTVEDIARVNIKAIADQAVAVFPQNYYEVNVNENNGSTIPLIDLNSIYETTSTLSAYTISDPNMEAIFSVDPDSGLVTIHTSLDYEMQTVYDLIVEANMATTSEVTKQLKNSYMHIGGQGPAVDLKNNQALVRVFVQDEDDLPPVFVNECMEGDKLTLAISAYTSAAQDAVQLQTTDNDTDPNNKIVYYFLDTIPSDFYVNQDTGILMASVPFTELESRPQTSYQLQVSAANSRDGSLNPSNPLDITIYILKQEQILLMNSSYPVDQFDRDHEIILSNLSSIVGQEIRGLKWVGTTTTSSTVGQETRGLKGVSTTTTSTKAYLYGLGSSGPLSETELMNMVKSNQAKFQANGFDAESAITYNHAPDMVVLHTDTYHDNNHIIAVSILGALLGVCLIAGAFFGWRTYQKKKKSKKFYRSMNDDFGRKSDDKPGFDTMDSSTHPPARRVSEAFNIEMKSEEHIGLENHIIPEEDNLEEILHSDSHIYPDLDYKEDSSPTELESKIRQYQTRNNLHELDDFPLASTAAEHIDSPSPDYFSMDHKAGFDDDEPAKSILVDSSIATEDTLEELQMKEDLMVTFNEVPEVIAVAAHEVQENIHQREDNDDDLGGLQ